MPRILSLLAASVLLVSLTTCGSLRKKPVSWRCPDSPEPTLETVTFNAGLAPGVVLYATPRTRAVAEAVGKLRGAGLICLQEVWEPEARDLVLEALDLPKENVFTVNTFAENEVYGEHRCEPGLLESVLSCVKKKCGDYAAEDRTVCARSKCYMPLAHIYLRDRNCIQCLFAMVGHDEDKIRDVCTSEAGCSRAYHGSNGTILASRWPLKDREVIRLPSSGVNRVALLATVDVPDIGEIEVGCTHLSSESEMAPVYPGFRSWADEMTAQFDMIEKRLGQRAKGKPQIFLGDFNAGPDRGGYGAHWPAVHRGIRIHASESRVWRRIMQAGFDSPGARALPTYCTTCGDNDLRGPGNNHLIDHVLLRDPRGGLDLEPVCSYPILDQPVDAITVKGEGTSVNLSDHYGAVVKFRRKARSAP